ncbi:MAG TPA: amidohydrolase family protein [Bryobacteraceae bacterium]
MTLEGNAHNHAGRTFLYSGIPEGNRTNPRDERENGTRLPQTPGSRRRPDRRHGCRGNRRAGSVAPSSGLDKLDRTTAGALARDTNDRPAAAVSAHPDRFAAFATLALPEPESAAQEFERCISKLNFKRLIVMGTNNGVFLDDARFTPIFEAAHSMDVPVYARR